MGAYPPSLSLLFRREDSPLPTAVRPVCLKEKEQGHFNATQLGTGLGEVETFFRKPGSHLKIRPSGFGYILVGLFLFL